MIKTTKEGMVIVEKLEDLDNPACGLYVYAICPKCKKGWNSVRPNAELILKNGCVICNPEQDWFVGIIPSTNMSGDILK